MKVLELVERLRMAPHDRRAQEDLYHLVSEALLPRIRVRIPRSLISRTDPEDVLHEAFLRSLRAIGRFHPKGEDSFLAWIYSIARNLISDQSRRRSVLALRLDQAKEEAGPMKSRILSQTRGPESQVQRRDWIDAILSRLPEKEAEVIRLRALRGLSFAEIASSWKKTPGAVQRFFSRAWRRFNALVWLQSRGGD